MNHELYIMKMSMLFMSVLFIGATASNVFGFDVASLNIEQINNHKQREFPDRPEEHTTRTQNRHENSRTEEQKVWLDRFFEGSLLVKGWKDRVAELLQGMSPSDEQALYARLIALGNKIGSEWAKDNEIRKIDTAMLKKWGSDLTKARKSGVSILYSEINKIDTEVEAILSRLS